MNYWPRWINAIKKRTATLSLAQMGAYDRLLDHYYAEESPLPSDQMECCRIAGAITKAEQDAVRFVLSKFFVLTDGGHRNERADEEILIALPKIKAAKANGSKGGRPKGSARKPSGFADGFPSATDGEPSPKHPHPHPYPQLGNTEDYPHLAGGCATLTDGHASDDAGDLSGLTATAAGAVCKAMRRVGVSDTNPGHPRLMSLLAAGATEPEFIGFAQQAAKDGKGFAWVLGAVEGERRRASASAGQLHRGPLPARKESGRHSGFDQKNYRDGVTEDGRIA